MKWFDTHAHFDTFSAEGSLAGVLERATAAEVGGICAVGGAGPANELAVKLSVERPGWIVAAVGYDRDQATQPHDLLQLKALTECPGVVAIGEIGLDYYYSPQTAGEQRALFRRQLELALECRRPVIVHCRQAEEDVIGALTDFSTAWKKIFHSVEKQAAGFPCPGKNFQGISTSRKISPERGQGEESGAIAGAGRGTGGGGAGLDGIGDVAGGGALPAGPERAAEGGLPPPGVLHCFTGDLAFAEELLALGFFISFSGIISFRNAGPLREVARRVPEDRVLVETDCPYLTPRPLRGKVNEPALIGYVGAALAMAREEAVEVIAAATEANARRLFQLEGRR